MRGLILKDESFCVPLRSFVFHLETVQAGHWEESEFWELSQDFYFSPLSTFPFLNHLKGLGRHRSTVHHNNYIMGKGK